MLQFNASRFRKLLLELLLGGKLIRDAKLNQLLFHSAKIKYAYKEFTVWFAKNKENQVATLKQHNFIRCFIRCDELWHDIPDYDALVIEFKPEGYYASLLEKLEHGKTSLRSIRMALQPVIDLYQHNSLKNFQAPNQMQIDTYLTTKPGQRNALYGFTIFLKKTAGMHLQCEMPEQNKLKKVKHKNLEKQFIALVRQAKPLSKKDELKWLQLGIAYFHNRTLSLKTLENITLITDENTQMLKLVSHELEYYLPHFKDFNFN